MDTSRMAGRILGPYRVEALLGAGGCGVVYRATDTGSGLPVALKVLPPLASEDPDACRRFDREIRLLSACSHPHIARVYGAGTESGVHYVAMELMAGTLADHLAAGAVMRGAVVSIGVQILRGLAAAHARGVVHRDIKPANIGLAETGVVKLLDFGAAHPTIGTDVTSSSPSTGPGLMGTIAYMAPEQLRGAAADNRADIYSAGAVLYELFAGRRPFPATQFACLIDDVLNRMPASLAVEPEDEALAAVVMRALAKHPADRFGSAGAMSAALREACRGSRAAPLYHLPGAAASAIPTGPRAIGSALWRTLRPRDHGDPAGAGP